jgi:hypothetical protein
LSTPGTSSSEAFDNSFSAEDADFWNYVVNSTFKNALDILPLQLRLFLELAPFGDSLHHVFVESNGDPGLMCANDLARHILGYPVDDSSKYEDKLFVKEVCEVVLRQFFVYYENMKTILACCSLDVFGLLESFAVPVNPLKRLPLCFEVKTNAYFGATSDFLIRFDYCVKHEEVNAMLKTPSMSPGLFVYLCDSCAQNTSASTSSTAQANEEASINEKDKRK